MKDIKSRKLQESSAHIEFAFVVSWVNSTIPSMQKNLRLPLSSDSLVGLNSLAIDLCGLLAMIDWLPGILSIISSEQ